MVIFIIPWMTKLMVQNPTLIKIAQSFGINIVLILAFINIIVRHIALSSFNGVPLQIVNQISVLLFCRFIILLFTKIVIQEGKHATNETILFEREYYFPAIKQQTQFIAEGQQP